MRSLRGVSLLLGVVVVVDIFLSGLVVLRLVSLEAKLGRSKEQVVSM